jgi:ABC-type Fe3+ transport system substrate-binding protein
MRDLNPINPARCLFAAFAIAFSMAAGHDGLAQTAPRDGAAVWTYLAALPQAERLATLKREAAREGELVIYSAIGLDRASVWLDTFKKENPGIKVEYLRMTTNELAQKTMTEFRAGRTNLDIFMSSSDWLNLVSDALAPYETTTWSDLDARFRHGGTAQGWTAIDFDSLIEVIAWRTDRVKAAEAPKNLDELAQPKWKGRAGTVKVREPFIDAMIKIYGEPVAMPKIDALAALDSRIFPSIAALSEALGAGEMDIAWGISGARAARLKSIGAPVDFVFQQPPMTLNETMAAGRLAKHPYAAALLLEFVTDVKTMEASDKVEPGRVFGHAKGKFTIPLAPDVFVYPAIPSDRYKDLNRIVEQKFIRQR